MECFDSPGFDNCREIRYRKGIRITFYFGIYISESMMRLIIDGYNLLHAGRHLAALNADDLQRERDRLLERLSRYRGSKPCEITVVFDGWLGGQATEVRVRKAGIDLVFSKLGEKADDVIKRLVKEKGPGTILITSDREVSHFAEKMEAAVIPSEEFESRMEMTSDLPQNGIEGEAGERVVSKGKGPSRRLSKKEKRARAALKKI